MKIKSYRALYHVFSFLSDKTNGASLFVKYKLALGVILVGLTTVSCSKEDDDNTPIMCYDPVTIPQEASLNDKKNVETLNIEEVISTPEISEDN